VQEVQARCWLRGAGVTGGGSTGGVSGVWEERSVGCRSGGWRGRVGSRWGDRGGGRRDVGVLRLLRHRPGRVRNETRSGDVCSALPSLLRERSVSHLRLVCCCCVGCYERSGALLSGSTRAHGTTPAKRTCPPGGESGGSCSSISHVACMFPCWAGRKFTQRCNRVVSLCFS
jgi:hypothetical protein